MNSFQINSLPYIKLKNPPLKLLVDTGSYTSLIRPIFAECYFPNLIFNSKLTLVTCNGESKTQYKAKILLLKEFGIETELEFILYNFHDYFDGILGIRDIQKLGLDIQLSNHKLINDYVEIPLAYRSEFNIQKIEIPPSSVVIKNIHTNIPDGTELYFEHLKSKNFEIPSSLLLVKKGTVALEIHNTCNESIIINYIQRFVL